ncbi:4'-phosphopantetheinyl transferase family protein [Streptomyces sp. NPDC059256]|uniref:4'-phosphopantetheinyl transferase family protein n=1 Tax=Streptomyces sp. NPDC059256 TaxID=3346794 RepID=UPI0036ADEB5B
MATEAPLNGEQTASLPGVELLWVGRVAEHAVDALAHRDVLDAAESARLDGFIRPQDRDAYAVGHVALRRLLGARLGQAPEAVVMERESCTRCDGPHGRPVLPGNAVHFSLSHTKGMVLIALASDPVGIDVEPLPRPTTVVDVTPQLHPAERREIERIPADQRPLAFARCWTRKESVLKARGVGLNEDLSLTYVGAGPQPAVNADWLLADVPVDPGFAAAVAVCRSHAPDATAAPDAAAQAG